MAAMPADLLAARVQAVDTARLQRHVAELSIVRHQLLNPLAIRRVVNYVREEFASYGCRVHDWPFYWWLSGWRRHVNLIATMTRTGDPPPTESARIMIGAHYDSVPFSPGADDNASGVAILLEAARVCAEPGLALRRPVEFVAFGAEEEGCIGSCRYADHLRRADADVAVMVSLECLGYTDARPNSQRVPPGLPIAVPDRGTFLGVIGNRAAQGLVTLMEAAVRASAPELHAIGLVVDDNGRQLPATRLSDHAPFWDRGYPALMLTDTAFLRNPHYHRAHDLPETLDVEFMTRVARSVVGFTLTAAT
jgi:aminopeptidase YwaD